MHKLVWLILVGLVIIIYGFSAQSVYAVLPSSDVIISQTQIGDSSQSRFIEIYNNTDTPVDITNWCLYHNSASGKTKDKLVCFDDTDKTLHIIFAARSYALIGSDKFGVLGDLTIVKGLGTSAGGRIYIVDGSGVEKDSLGWGNVDNNPEGQAVIFEPDNVNKILERRLISPSVYADTNDNLLDFVSSNFREKYTTGAISDVIDICKNMVGIQVLIPDGYYLDSGDCLPVPVDVCANLDGLQIIIPAGYMLDSNNQCQMDICLNIDDLQLVLPDSYSADGLGNCYPPPPIDVCSNLDGLQEKMPDGMELDVSNNCIQHDECSNLPEIQTAIPNGFTRGVDNSCLLGLLPLQLSELLPNAAGSDIGNEYIEIYNPNDTDVSLLYYLLYVGPDDSHFYSFPVSSHIMPHQYLSLTNNDIKFTLVNTASSVRLRAIDNSFVDEASYSNPGDGLAWALIDGLWQYTNRPTPGNVNLPMLIEPIADKVAPVSSSLQPCADNQYRNPETNRCRLIPVVSSTVTPCKDGQYRSEETNRCRNIVSNVVALTMCAEGQERNPETNRCRTVTAVLGASDLAPCKAGQERNPDTNRCRNVISSIPVAAYATIQTSESSNNYIGWWSLIGVGAVAIVYGIWEWRQEIINIIRKLGAFRHFGK